MAKKPKPTEDKSNVNVEILKAIAASTDTFYISKDDGLPLLNANLIEVNGEMLDANGNAAARLTEAGQALLDKSASNAAPGVTTDAPKASAYGIITNAVLPASKRGGKGGGAPTQYPFADLPVDGSFFVPVSEKHPDPVKTLGSTVSSANMRFAVDTGEKKTVKRAKRDGRKALRDAAGNKIVESVEVPVYKFERKFSIRGVEKGKQYGEWVAPEDGALIARIL